jgi:protein-L-isoaspartate(D-aspartate) O-methyltransferase
MGCILLTAFCLWAHPLPAQEGQDRYRAAREAMVDLITEYGVRDSATLEALRSVPRHEFVPAASRHLAYGDHPLPIEEGQTISQPYIVAYMTAVLAVRPGMKVLEVGTGSGYQAAILAAIGAQVFTIEIFETLAVSARARLERLGYRNVTVRHGDGYLGWEDEAPFDAVIVTAAPDHIPRALTDQLRRGGRLVIPVGSTNRVQTLTLVEKTVEGTLISRRLMAVRFVPFLRIPR